MRGKIQDSQAHATQTKNAGYKVLSALLLVVDVVLLVIKNEKWNDGTFSG